MSERIDTAGEREGEGARGESESGALGEGGEEGRRPTPARMAMEGEAEEGETSARGDRVVQDPETGERWRAIVAGHAASGVPPFRSIPLMELHFFRGDDRTAPTRRVVCRTADLAEMSQSRLLELLDRSTEFTEAPGEAAEADRSRRRSGRGRRQERR